MKFVAHVLASSSCYVFFNGAVEALFSNFTGNSSSSHSLVGDWIRDNNNLAEALPNSTIGCAMVVSLGLTYSHMSMLS